MVLHGTVKSVNIIYFLFTLGQLKQDSKTDCIHIPGFLRKAPGFLHSVGGFLPPSLPPQYLFSPLVNQAGERISNMMQLLNVTFSNRAASKRSAPTHVFYNGLFSKSIRVQNVLLWTKVFQNGLVTKHSSSLLQNVLVSKRILDKTYITEIKQVLLQSSFITKSWAKRTSLKTKNFFQTYDVKITQFLLQNGLVSKQNMFQNVYIKELFGSQNIKICLKKIVRLVGVRVACISKEIHKKFYWDFN